MPKMKSPDGKVRELPYDMEGEEEAKLLEAKGWKRVKVPGAMSHPKRAGMYKATQTTRYQVGGLVHRSGPKRKRVKARGTGAATRGLDFYKG